jgi:hypothetical protein
MGAVVPIIVMTVFFGGAAILGFLYAGKNTNDPGCVYETTAKSIGGGHVAHLQRRDRSFIHSTDTRDRGETEERETTEREREKREERRWKRERERHMRSNFIPFLFFPFFFPFFLSALLL